MIIVRGRKDDGLQPVYYASEKARACVESQFGVNVERFLTLFEDSAINGAAGAFVLLRACRLSG